MRNGQGGVRDLALAHQPLYHRGILGAERSQEQPLGLQLRLWAHGRFRLGRGLKMSEGVRGAAADLAVGTLSPSFPSSEIGPTAHRWQNRYFRAAAFTPGNRPA